MMETFSKIFGIGLPKTGTKSLNMALNDLGFKSIHFARRYRNCIWNKNTFEFPFKFNALTNFGEWHFAQLDKTYPNSKFILTVRNKDSWLKSCKLWYTPQKRGYSASRISVFGTQNFSHDRYAYIYDFHTKAVLEYFKYRKNDLLILDICSGEGWNKLCNFLNVEIPEHSFPHAHEVATDDKKLKKYERTKIKREQNPNVKIVTDSKIFGIGLPCTGDMSLNIALRILKIKSFYNSWKIRQQIWREGNYSFKKDFEAIVNIGTWNFAQLDETYPNSKFILTISDKKEWLTRCESVFTHLEEGKYPLESLKRIDIFKVKQFHKDQFEYIYDFHTQTVLDYFKDRKNDLLVLDISATDSWGKLCNFLNQSIPSIDTMIAFSLNKKKKLTNK